MNDRQIARHAFRVRLFTRRGWKPDKAEAWADRLIERDADRDDRRLCIECSALQRTGGCFQAQQGRLQGIDRRLTPITDLLQRCEGFQWQTQ